MEFNREEREVSRSRLPTFAELGDHSPPFTSWGVWSNDQLLLGTLNLQTPESIKEAAELVQRGKVFRLDAPIGLIDPPLFGRMAVRHEVLDLPDNAGHDEIISEWNTQESSQWDGFRHIRHPTLGFYGGLEDSAHGVDHWAQRGIIGRGVVVDIAAYRRSIGEPLDMCDSDAIEVWDVENCLAQSGITIHLGDILLIYTGWLDWYKELSAEGRRDLARGKLKAPGLRPSDQWLEYLWDHGVSAVAADNPSLEAWPPGSLATPEVRAAVKNDRSRVPEIFMHYSLIPKLGMPLGELWDLGDLVNDCRDDGRFECFMVSAPLRLRQGVASPPNTLALK